MLRTMIATGLFVALASCGSDNGSPTTSLSEQQSPSASQAAAPEADTSLQGTWVTDPLSEDEIESTLRKHVLANWI